MFKLAFSVRRMVDNTIVSKLYTLLVRKENVMFIKCVLIVKGELNDLY